MLNILCNLLNDEVKNGMVVSVFVVYSGDLVADWELHLAASTQHLKRVLYRSPGKRSKFNVWILMDAYHFCTVVK